MAEDYTARNLEEIAEAFETFASDQIGSKRWLSTKREKTECDIKAATWRDAADILRKTTLTISLVENETTP